MKNKALERIVERKLNRKRITGSVKRVARMRKRTYYSLHWRINGHEAGISGALTEMAAHAITVLGRGADVVVITKCQTESAF